jgi:hypothetical protein
MNPWVPVMAFIAVILLIAAFTEVNSGDGDE